MDHSRLFIGVEFVDGARGERCSRARPGPRRAGRHRRRASSRRNAAVDAARRAFDSGGWSGKTPVERAEIVLELARPDPGPTARSSRGVEAQDSAGSSCGPFSDVFMGAKFFALHGQLRRHPLSLARGHPFRTFPFSRRTTRAGADRRLSRHRPVELPVYEWRSGRSA